MGDTQQKLDELELLESMYPGIISVDPDDIVRCQDFFKSSSHIAPSIQVFVKFESFIKLAITLPSAYPSLEAPPFRVDTSKLTNIQDEEILKNCTSIASDNLGEGVLLQVISMVLEYLEDIKVDEEEKKVRPKSKNSFNRFWYYSHHIYSKEKRTSMLSWCKELCLSGFILPGKPGIILVEGAKKNCKEFNSRIRSMTWQMLRLQHEEYKLDQSNLKFSGFNELIFDVNSRNHQNLGQFREYLDNLQLGHVFSILFNI